MKRPPRDPKKMTREIDATIKLRDIREWANLREALAPRYGEMFLLAGLFAFALGLVLTLIFALPQENEAAYFFWLLWACGFILMNVVATEFLIRKFRIIRRVIELNLRRIDRLEREVAALKKELAAQATGDEKKS